jgi:hypothetical protein
MSKKLLSNRIDPTAFISSGPDDINGLEADVADLLGLTLNQLYEDSPFSFDSDGNITSARAGDSAQTLFTGTDGATGIRILSTTGDGKEVLLSIKSDEFVIYENTADPLGETADWQERFVVALDGEEDDNEGQDILNHANFPEVFESLQYLRSNENADALEFASFDAATPPSAGVRHVGTASIPTGGVGYNYLPDPMVVMLEDWDNASIYHNYAAPGGPAVPYMEITSAGIYLVQITANWQTGDGTDGGHRDMGYNQVSGVGFTRFERVAPIDATGDVAQTQSVSFIEKFAFEDKIYVKFGQTSGANLGISLNRFAVTKISQES